MPKLSHVVRPVADATVEAQSSTGAVAFGPFQFLAKRRLLLRYGEPVRLGCRGREILAALTERAGQVVEKRELIARVWPDTIVEEGTLRVHIVALRKALGSAPGGMQYVENVHGHGYRFVAPVVPCRESPGHAIVRLAIYFGEDAASK